MTREDLDLFWDRAIMSGVDEGWHDGLGLMDRRERYVLMASKAIQRYELFLGQGMSSHEAIDEALGLGPSLRGDLTRVVEEGLTKVGPTLSDLT